MTLYQKLDLTWKFAVLALACWVLCCEPDVDGSFVSADVAVDVVSDRSADGRTVQVRKTIDGGEENVSVTIDGEGLSEGLAALPDDIRGLVEDALGDASIEIEDGGDSRRVVVIKKSVDIEN